MSTLVCFHAHPDDESIATGGTMALAARAGHRVVLVVATRGELGEPVPGVLAEGEPLWERRVVETRRAGEIVGAERVEFLGYTDSGMMGEPTNDDPECFWRADVEEAAGRLAAILSDVDADVLTVYDDHGGYGHPDHIQVHRVGVRAAELAGVGAVFQSTMNRDQIREAMERYAAEAPVDGAPVVEPPRDVGDDFGSPDSMITHAVDVRAVIDVKRDAMKAHASQIAPDSFFLALPVEMFAVAFGTEWFIELDGTRAAGTPYEPSLLPAEESPVRSR
jgi:LmbE family N-acetylglucosaminyl deacetylase